MWVEGMIIAVMVLLEPVPSQAKAVAVAVGIHPYFSRHRGCYTFSKPRL